MITERNRKRLARKNRSADFLAEIEKEKAVALHVAYLRELDALSKAKDAEKRNAITQAYDEARRQINAL